MDFIVVTHRNQPFIDGETYRRMCFGCAHVPKEYILTYDEEGSVLDEIGPFYTYKRLCSAKDLHEAGTTPTLGQAQKCVRAVKARLKKVGKKKLDKLKLKRPKHEFEMNEDFEEAELKKYQKQDKKKKGK
jgi:hypothetical protein